MYNKIARAENVRGAHFFLSTAIGLSGIAGVAVSWLENIYQ
jgi:hypothetical protein